MALLNLLERWKLGQDNIGIHATDYVLQYFVCHPHNVGPNITAGQFEDFNPEPPVYAAKFSDRAQWGHMLLLASEDGMIAIQDTSKPQPQELAGFQAHRNAIFDVSWVPGAEQVVTVSGDSTAAIWDVQRLDSEAFPCVTTFNGHSKSVKSVAFKPDDHHVFATGGRDSLILVWDARSRPTGDGHSNKPENAIKKAHCISGLLGEITSPRRKREAERICGITALVFQNDHTLISSGDGDGQINIWDLRRNYSAYRRDPVPVQSLVYSGDSSKCGFSCMSYDASNQQLYASCMDNTVYQYNMYSDSSKPVAEYSGHINSSYCIKSCVSPGGEYLLSGSADGCGYIWSLAAGCREPLVKLVGHNTDDEVTAVAWCTVEDTKVVTCGDDFKHAVWKIDRNERSQSPEKRPWGEAELLNDPAVINSRKRRFNKDSREKSQLVREKYELRTPAKKVPLTPKPSATTPRNILQWLRTPESSRKRLNSGSAEKATPSKVRSPYTPGTLRLSPSKRGMKRKLEDTLEDECGTSYSVSPTKRGRLSESPSPTKRLKKRKMDENCVPDSMKSPKMKCPDLVVDAQMLRTPSSKLVLKCRNGVTADLPNLMGRNRDQHLHSPRPNTAGKKLQVNWLQDLSRQRKMKFTPDALLAKQTGSLRKHTPDAAITKPSSHSEPGKAGFKHRRNSIRRKLLNTNNKSLINYFNKPA